MPSKTDKPSANFDVSANLLKKLADTMGNADLSEIEYVDGERSLRLSRAPQAQTVVAAAPLGAPTAMPASAMSQVAAPAAATPAGGQATPEAASSVKTIDSPMVGTVYLAAEPGAANFVSVGDEIKEGDTLMIIEAMKVMNHLPSPQSGIVRQILVGDGEPVEFGQPLIELA